jgi:hypothetical protein
MLMFLNIFHWNHSRRALVKPQFFPLSRQKDLVEQELKGEVLIYDLKIHKVHCLNDTCAMVWQMCDGTKSVSEISRLIGEKLKTPVTEDFIWLALDELKAENLLDNSREIEAKFEGVSRRELIMKAGLLATMIALPLITSQAAALPGDAQSAACVVESPCTCSVTNGTALPQGCINSLGGTSTCAVAKGCDCLVASGGTTGVCNSSS